MAFMIMQRTGIFIIIGLTASATFLSVQDHLLKLNHQNSQKQTGSFGISIKAYRSVTIAGEKDNFIAGSEGGEDFLGGAGNDEILAYGGDDFLNGEAGDDVLNGGSGRDIVLGGLGNDTIIGADSFELIDGGEGLDTLIIPYTCSNYTLGDISNDTKVFRNACGKDLITLKSIENIIVETAPLQGPMPKSKIIRFDRF
jgi:Ca2+-binding RTX toxin-like protein